MQAGVTARVNTREPEEDHPERREAVGISEGRESRSASRISQLEGEVRGMLSQPGLRRHGGVGGLGGGGGCVRVAECAKLSQALTYTHLHKLMTSRTQVLKGAAGPSYPAPPPPPLLPTSSLFHHSEGTAPPTGLTPEILTY